MEIAKETRGSKKKYTIQPFAISVRFIGEESKVKLRDLEKKLLKKFEIKN